MMFAQRLSTAPEPSVACGAGRWWSPSYAHQPRSATNSSAVPSSRREERRARGCSATRKHLPWVVPRARLFVFRAVGPHGRTPRALLCRRIVLADPRRLASPIPLGHTSANVMVLTVGGVH